MVMQYCSHLEKKQGLKNSPCMEVDMDKVKWMLNNSDLKIVKVNNKYILQSWEDDYQYSSLEALHRDLELAYDEWMKEE